MSFSYYHFFLQGSARSQPASTGLCLVLGLMLLEISLQQAESEIFVEILYVWWELDKAASCYIYHLLSSQGMHVTFV